MKRDPALYRQMARRNYSERLSWHTRKLSEIAPTVQKVEVEVSIEFRSGVLPRPEIKHYTVILDPDSVVCLVFQCPNPDCTSGVFDITNAVISLIQQKKNGSGEQDCSGREDVKYCGGGSFCDTTLKYSVSIIDAHRF